MKSFKELLEDVMLSSWMSKPGQRKRPYINMSKEKWIEHADNEDRVIKSMGRIGKEYTMYSSVRRGDYTPTNDKYKPNIEEERVSHYKQHYIVIHNNSNTVIASSFGHAPENGEWQPKGIFVDPEHTSTQTGTSIPVEMYKIISKHVSIVTDGQQTVGGANIWQKLRSDPKNNIALIQSSGKTVPAHGVSDNEIWTIGSKDKTGQNYAKSAGLSPKVVDLKGLSDNVADVMMKMPKKK